MRQTIVTKYVGATTKGVTMKTKLTKEQALSNAFDGAEVTVDGNRYEVDGKEYLVLTAGEADIGCEEYILESAWACRPEFLVAHSVCPVEAFQCLQIQLAEDANKPILAMIDDHKHFVKSAIRADGRGHFLAEYDGEELELDGGFFAYRVN